MLFFQSAFRDYFYTSGSSLSFLKYIFIDVRDRERDRDERERGGVLVRERNISQLPHACILNGDQICNIGMCADQKQNL